MTADERERLARAEEREEENARRIKILEDQQQNMMELIQTVAAIAQKQADMDADLKEIKGDVKSISLKPAKRWEGIVEKAILAAVGILITYIAIKMGFAQ